MDAIKEFGEKRYIEPLPARYKAGPLRVHPSIKNTFEYDSNILLEQSDMREDVVYNVTPGAILELPIDKHQLIVGYEADMEVFMKPRNATRQNDQNQNAFALANFHFPSWYVNVLENFSETSGRSGTTFTERIPRFDQSIHPKIGYRWKRFIFEQGFRHFVRDFRRQIDDSLDFQIAEWTSVIYYDLFARLKALLEYQWAQIDYDDNFSRNGTFNQVRVGLDGEVIPNMMVKLRVGPQFRNYEVKDEPNFNSWVADASVEYQIRENLKLNASIGREAVEATFSTVNFYKQHILRLGFEHKIRPNWIFASQFKYYRHNYAERTLSGSQFGFRHDNHFVSRTSLKYLFREWLEFELAYQYAYRQSNLATFEYTDHRVSLSSNLLY